MLKKIPLAAAVSILLGWHGQTRAQTTLNLSATGQAIVVPDQITATLTAQATSSSPVAAQASVNAAMAAALAAAKAVTGVTATTSGYNVTQDQGDNGAGPVKFDASETLDLVAPAPGGVPAKDFAALLGRLQQRGLLLENYDGSLSAAESRRAMQGAIADALAQIQAQAQDVATGLGETIARVTTVNLNYNVQTPLPMAPRAMMMTAMPAPAAAPASQTVQAEVTATVELRSH